MVIEEINLNLDNRGIATVDLLFATLIFLIIVVGFVNLISSEMDKTQAGELGKARMLGERIAEAINTVYINGRGYSVNLTLPSDFNFTAYVNSAGYVTVTYKGNNTTINLISKSNLTNVTMTTGQRYQVKNNNGTITFTLL